MTSKQFTSLLEEAFDKELNKSPEQMDTDFIDSFLDLLS